MRRLRPGCDSRNPRRRPIFQFLDEGWTLKLRISQARKRGILFDIGHGMGSFEFKTARAMMANGFAPDCISSDVHALCIDGPAFDLLTTMSKFLCLGMKLDDVVRAATATPAKAIRRDDLGSLLPGSVGDASILELERGAFDYVDVVGERIWPASPRITQ